MRRILGLDVGTNSLGWAVVDRDEATGTCALRRAGSVIFPEGVNTDGPKEQSRAAERTRLRGIRRQYFRRRLRKIAVLRVLTAYRLCPPLAPEALADWNTHRRYPMDDDFLLWQRTSEAEGRNPYACRHRCLHETLDLTLEADRYTLGRAFYHIAERRGFKSNRLDDSADDDETGAVKAGISELSELMREAHCQYLGDYFYTLYNEGGKIRTRYTDRLTHYLAEFEAICERQQLEPALRDALRHALFFQRPLRSQRQGVGRCTFEPTKQRVSVSHPLFEEFRMLQLLNDIRITESDKAPRPLTDEERKKAMKKFYRKQKPQFDFDDIASAIAGRRDYQCKNDPPADHPAALRFNFARDRNVSGCPFTTDLRNLFGDDYRSALLAAFVSPRPTAADDAVDELWAGLKSCRDAEDRAQWGQKHLGLTTERAKAFAALRISGGYASLSVAALRRIVPWMRGGMQYSHAVMMAKVPDIVGHDVWEQRGDEITNQIQNIFDDIQHLDPKLRHTLASDIKDYLESNFPLAPGRLEKLYHPSMIGPYPDVPLRADGIPQLGSPRTDAVRNPMAMRSLHEIRRLVNTLLRERVIDQRTELHVEYARELNDANRRQAIDKWNRQREQKRQTYRKEIQALGIDNPSDNDLLRYELWREQDEHCLYTGRKISVTEIIGDSPRYDIEHTIPRSAGGDFTRENLTLCDSRYNRETKRTLLPINLPNYADIMVRLEPYRERIAQLRGKIRKLQTYAGQDKDARDSVIQERHYQRLQLDYYQGKYHRFTMPEVPEGFARRQGAGIGLVGKYAGLYLRSLFHTTDSPSRSLVRVVKGAMTAEFRELWGLQKEYEKKSRDRHTHHTIDAIVIACIGPAEHSQMASWYTDYDTGRASKPKAPLPWCTFAEDVRRVAEETIVVHDTRDNLAKPARRRLPVPSKKGKDKSEQKPRYTGGDSARGSLHGDTYYGAIQQEGDIRYVVRRRLDSLTTQKQVDTIVDPAVRAAVQRAIDEHGLAKAVAGTVYLNEAKGVVIKKVRCVADKVKSPNAIGQHRDVSRHEYKRRYYVTNDENYVMAIYEGVEKGKTAREYKLVSNLAAAQRLKKSVKEREEVVPAKSPKGFSLRYVLRKGLHVILYEHTPEEVDFTNAGNISRRLYVVTGMSRHSANYGRVELRHHQEARQAEQVKNTSGIYREHEAYRGRITMLHTQFKALIEGVDFTLNVLGEVTLK